MMVRLSKGNQSDSTALGDDSERAREETTATVQANIEAWLDAFVLVSTVHTAAVEHHTVMNVAQRVTTRIS